MVETTIEDVLPHVNTSLHPRQIDVERTASELSVFRRKSVETYLSRQCGERASTKHVILNRAAVSSVVDDAMFRQLYVSMAFANRDGAGFNASNATLAALLNTTEGVVKNTNTRLSKAGVIHNQRKSHAPSIRTFRAVSHLLDPILPPIVKSLGDDLTVAKSLVDDLRGCQVTGGCLENDCQVTPAGTQVLPLLDDDNDDEPAPRSDDRPPREKVKTTTSPSPAVPWNDSKNGSKEQSLKDRVLNPVPFWQPKGKREYDDLSDKLLEAANGAVFPLSSIAQGMVVEPIRWVEDGCDLDLHIIPAIRTVAARLKANSDQMRSWKICEREVYKNRDASLAAGPAVVGASSPASQGAGRYAVVNGAKRFRDEARLPRVQFHGLAGEDGNRILDAVPGATTEIVMRAIEDAGRRAAKDVSFGDVIGFCIEWCEKRVGGQNDE